MEEKLFVEIAQNLIYFLEDRGIEFTERGIWEEKEWTDFRFGIKDPAQMKRLDTWFRDDIKNIITHFSDVEISAPIPMVGKEDELRIRVYELDKKTTA